MAPASGSSTAYGAIDDGALGVLDGRIAFVGAVSDLPGRPNSLARDIRQADGRWITPGLIDCHTHLVFGGDRSQEFEMRLNGASYAELQAAGGGILSTVRATRMATEDELVAAALPRLDALLGEGVTTIEIKSGYGLETETELKMLRAARRLAALRPVTVKTTFLGAHALPEAFKGRSGDYIDLVCGEMLPAAVEAGLVDAVDVFCETIGFDLSETERVLAAADGFGVPVKIHAEQLSDMGGAALAARHHALSADHLEYLSAEGVAAMARSGTVAVLLPGAFYVLRETRLPPIALLREQGVAMALATDANPGSSPVLSLLLILSMAATLFRMTPEEALRGITVNAARALGIQATHGTLEVGKAADFVLWDIERPGDLAYWVGRNPLHQAVRGGAVVIER
jgi:imidazolonepropionase